MQKRKVLIANWKTYIQNTAEIDLKIKKIKNQIDIDSVNLVICPSFIYLQQIANELKNTKINLGSQNLSYFETNVNTGEVLASMLTDIGCHYSILGHSEVRKTYNECSNIVSSKVRIALKHNIIPIICVGEKLETRKGADYLNFLIDQTVESLPQINNLDQKELIIAYEPIWSIGTGKIPSNDQIAEVINTLKSYLGFKNSRFLYGGSINAYNIDKISKIESLDGLLVGGASIEVSELDTIYKKFCHSF